MTCINVTCPKCGRKVTADRDGDKNTFRPHHPGKTSPEFAGQKVSRKTRVSLWCSEGGNPKPKEA